MNSFINYIIESTISISVFYIFYELFLKRDTWFRFNRYYLLFGLIFSFVLPMLDFSAASFVVNSQNQFEFKDYLIIGNSISSFEETSLQQFSVLNSLLILYTLIASLFLAKFILQLIKIFKIVKAYDIIRYKNYKLVLISKDSAPYSFFNYIFLNKDDYGLIGSNELLLHEIIHARQKHSFDIILLELLLVLQWFNPFIYRYRLALKEVHEYLADRGVLLKNSDKIAYQKLILDQIEKSFSIHLASQFNYSLTKNRIKMMTRINSSKIATLKIVLIVPLLVFLLSAFTINTARESVEYKNILDLQSLSNISSGFGMRMHPIKKEKMMHKAVDIKAPKGTPVYATADGLIRNVTLDYEEGKGYGMYIIIDHENGYSTLYSQLSEYNIKEGSEVKQGDVIGYVGSSGISTGPHLHYEVMKDGENVNPENYF